MSRDWRNWGFTAQATAAEVVAPRSVAEVVAAVERAGDADLPVKAVGNGHSFTGIAVTDGVRLELHGLDRIWDLDTETGLVTVGAGIRLDRLNELLWQHGLAMSNLGDIAEQTLAGAISTGTHGTGAAFGGISTQVRGMQLVLADGTVVLCSATERPELFAAARVGLGALGIVTSVTLQCEPAYALHAVERPARLSDVLADLDAAVDGNDHYEFYWFPHTDRVLAKTHNRAPWSAGLRPLGRLRGWVDDELLANRVYELVNRLGHRAPALVPAINQVSARGLAAREFTDRSYRVLTTRRAVRFREMEYAVPRAALPDVLRELRRWVDEHDERICFPVEVRFAAADGIWLSPAHGRESAYVAVHRYHRTPYQTYFGAAEAILTSADGRPHWGKLHSLDAEALRELYPHFDDFVALRSKLDPAGRFSNRHLERVLGTTPTRGGQATSARETSPIRGEIAPSAEA